MDRNAGSTSGERIADSQAAARVTTLAAMRGTART